MKNFELEKLCEVCNSKFIGSADKRACSKKCYMKIWNAENKEHVKNYKKEYYHNGNPEYKAYCDKKSTLWMYSLSVEKYDEMVRQQDGHCALCERRHDDNVFKLHVDHDHNCCSTRGRKKTCGECNRGLLCGICNRKLGFLEKFLPEALLVEAKEYTWLHKALAYIEKYKVKI